MFDWKPVHRANAGAGVDWLRKLVSHLLVIDRQNGTSKPKNLVGAYGGERQTFEQEIRTNMDFHLSYHHIQIR